MKNMNCPNCSKQLSVKAIFCSKCKTQVRCKECAEPLEQDALCCEVCGTDTERRDQSNPVMNRIKYDGINFEAEFTDTVGKDVTETFGKIFMENHRAKTHNQIGNGINEQSNYKEEVVDVEAEIIDEAKQNANQNPKNSADGINSIIRDKDGKLNLLETRIKAESKIDFGMRLTYLTMLFYKNKGHDTIDKSKILELLKYCGVYDANYRKAFAKAKAHFIVDVGKIEFRPAGLEKANEILKSVFEESIEGKWKLSDLKTSKHKGTSGSKTASGKGKKSTKTTSSQILKLVSGLNLHPKDQPSMKEYYNVFDISSNFEKNLIFVNYLENILKEDDRGLDHIYTCYKTVGERIPKNLYQSLIDTRRHKAWIDTSNVSKLSVTTNGENAIEHDLKRK